MGERIRLVVVAIVINWLTVQALAGSSRLSGPVILTLSHRHGVHLDDLLTVLGWLIAMAWCVRQWRRWGTVRRSPEAATCCDRRR